MKEWKAVLIGFLALMVAGIGITIIGSNAPPPQPREAQYSIVEVDGCEYIYLFDQSLTHKGNCKNEIHWQRAK